MKKILFLLLLIYGTSCFSQKYFTRTGATDFKASVDVFEPIEAKNKSTTVLLKTSTGEIVAQLFMTAFQFKIGLMQEHFNENYMESYTYPKATFKGKLVDFNLSTIEEKSNYTLKGILTIKGISKEITTTASLKKEKKQLTFKANFSVTPQDFEIEIPAIVRKKIAKKVDISLDYVLEKKA